jgi:hypothetical protein
MKLKKFGGDAGGGRFGGDMGGGGLSCKKITDRLNNGGDNSGGGKALSGEGSGG